MIEFDHVTKKYLSSLALDDISFQLKPGKITGLVGANGSGKSTTLKLIAGLIHPTKGDITIDGEPAHRRLATKVAYLSELDATYDFFTIRNMLQYYSQLFPDFDWDKAQAILDFMDLSNERKIKHLSKGNRGRLKIVLTLARDVPIILMDEPLSGLDPMVRDAIVKGLISFIDLDKQLVLITTHEIREIEALLDEVMVVKDGQLLGRQDVETLRVEKNMSIVDWMKHVYQ
ncbi:ABC transporter ATP-binding protein [Tuberibacillus sp. Marseille-P3662]|uniref:ABC transporter ATP-binding protein n=1 Tax=Tuberibacillus sp. Marseille-P3662 TaxID=1965358 RepID=UPI000A1CD41E|nr:ABC transporter ATP-binding protein [Tuberibacillus sp. Marseille-P3662]